MPYSNKGEKMQLSATEKKIIQCAIRDIPDFPKQGIVFKDITTLLNDKHAYGVLTNHLYQRYKSYNLDYVAGIDARGFIFGAALAQMLGVGFVPIRKKGKLPYTTISEKYALEYGVDEIEIHLDAFRDTKDAKVLLIDDLIATGGTAVAAAKLIHQAGAECVEACFILGLTFLEGLQKLSEHTTTYTLVEVN